jgi:hypothetical protein
MDKSSIASLQAKIKSLLKRIDNQPFPTIQTIIKSDPLDLKQIARLQEQLDSQAQTYKSHYEPLIEQERNKSTFRHAFLIKMQAQQEERAKSCACGSASTSKPEFKPVPTQTPQPSADNVPASIPTPSNIATSGPSNPPTSTKRFFSFKINRPAGSSYYDCDFKLLRSKKQWTFGDLIDMYRNQNPAIAAGTRIVLKWKGMKLPAEAMIEKFPYTALIKEVDAVVG